MNPILNTQFRFYDYFPHITVARMKDMFGVDYFGQTVIRSEIQKVINSVYDNLVSSHDLVHVDVYDGIDEKFDSDFYNELKSIVRRHFHNDSTWIFVDKLLPQKEIEDELEYLNFQTKVTTALGYSLPRSITSQRVQLKDALVALLNYDLDALDGQELYFLTKLK